uniref:Uncharacterized protein n=1 Tax=Rhizophora mucronata TaxID=61149 RepID=A0A2P2NQ16_RHIMU
MLNSILLPLKDNLDSP